MKSELGNIIADLDFVIRQINDCNDILKRNKGIGADKCSKSLSKVSDKYSKIKDKLIKL